MKKRRMLSKSRAVAVDTLPPGGAPYPVLYPLWPLVPTLPTPVVDGQRWNVGADMASAVEYLGRSVVELNGPDYLYIPLINGGNFVSSPCFIEATIRDVVPGIPSVTVLFRANLSGSAVLQVTIGTNATFIYLELRQGGVTLYSYSGSGLVLADGNNHKLKTEFSGGMARLYIDGVLVVSGTTAGWSGICDSWFTYDHTTSVRPLQVCCIQQSLNGVLIDNIPCDETTGTTLRNTISEDRPATLSDATAHALAWVPQPSKQMAVWMWDGDSWEIIA